MKPGIYKELSIEDYHKDKGSYSKSSLSDFAVYPYNLVYQRKHPKESTAFSLGTAAHTAILEPEKWETTVAVCPNEMLGKNGAKSTKAYKEWRESQPAGMTTLTEAERDKVLRARDSVHANPAHSKAKELLSGGIAEVSFFWNEGFSTDELFDNDSHQYFFDHSFGSDGHQMLIKCRPDYIPGNRIAVDLKTTAQSISQVDFERTAYNLKYHWSAALTLRGMTKATQKTHRTYIFVVVEIEPPNEVAVFRASEDFLALGAMETMEISKYLAWCDYNDKWPGAPNVIQQIGLPGWAHRKLNDGIN